MTINPDSLDGLTTLDCANLVASSSKIASLLSAKLRFVKMRVFILVQLTEIEKEIEETEKEKIHDKSVSDYLD